jgi:hypothetical protein
MTPSQNAAVANIVEEKITRKLDCKKPGEYSFEVVQNVKREEPADPVIPEDLNVVVGGEVVAKIELPKADREAKNFSLNSVEKTKAGFEVKVDWGGGRFHYEIQYNFRCKENHFYLYRVKNDNYSTKNPDSGNFLDVKRSRITRVNIPIEKVVMIDYLR